MAIPKIYDARINIEIVKMQNELIPIEKPADWKGRAVGFGESVKRKFNQIINVFKTWKWDVEKQTMVKLRKDIHKFTQIANNFSKTQVKKNRPQQIEIDITLRNQFAERLDRMKSTLDLIGAQYKGSSESKQFTDLQAELAKATAINEEQLEEEKEQLKMTKNIAVEAASVGKSKTKDMKFAIPASDAAMEESERFKKEQESRRAVRLNKRAAEVSKTERPHKGGKISKKRIKDLDEALKRKHLEEVPVLVGKKKEKKPKEEEELELLPPSRVKKSIHDNKIQLGKGKGKKI